jgi:hypothetical protein
MAVIAAVHRGRYHLFVRAMEKRGMQPIIIEDLVKFGEDRGEARGEARGVHRGTLDEARRAVLEALDARGLVIADVVRARVLEEGSLDQLRGWLRRAVVADRVEEVFAAE